MHFRETGAVAVRPEHIWDRLLAGEAELVELDACSPSDRIEMVRAGVPAGLLTFLADAMGVSRDWLYQSIGVARSTADRKIRDKRRLSPDESERALGIARLIGQVERIVGESGDPQGFDAAGWVAGWLDRPNPALGGVRPASLMDTAEGRTMVADVVSAMQSGAYV
jgi:putative toxin-antitoxin system antitoxin component (TIGR02293 family)